MKKIIVFLFIMFLGNLSADDLTQSKSKFTLANGATITIFEVLFDESKHNITKCSNGYDICKIDNQAAYGVVDKAPKTYVESITAIYQNQTYKLDSSDMYNAWGDREQFAPASTWFKGECKDKYNCTFRGLFSDAAGAFAVEWKVINGQSVRTSIGMSADNFFNSHLEPKAYQNLDIPYYKSIVQKMTYSLMLKDGANITISNMPFDKSKHRIEQCKNINAICRINGNIPFGVSENEYKISHSYLKNITVNYKNVTYALDTKDMYGANIYAGGFDGTCIEHDDDYRYCAFRGVFMGNENSYVAEWKLNLNTGDSIRTTLTSSKDAVEYFIKNIKADIFYY